MTPFYTRMLSQAEYGVTDLLIQTGNFLIPIVSAGILHAVMRFGLERGTNKQCVFTIGLCVVLLGNMLLLLLGSSIEISEALSNYFVLLFLFVLMANLHSLCGNFAQVLGRVRLYVISGILCTVMAVALNILLLAVFDFGITGYILANVIADGISALILFVAAGMIRYIDLKSVSFDWIKSMFGYCLPLIPATICTWIINISDRYFISYLIGNEATGLYAVSNKISSILLIVSGIFASAWQLSALRERNKREKERFFSNVFSVYESGILILASGLSPAAPTLMHFLAAPDYYPAWHYAPALLLSASMACLGAFFSSIYVVEKRSMAALATALSGAVVNLLGNSLLIPMLGVMGAAISTCFSYLIILLIRVIHSRKFLRIQWDFVRFAASMALLILQCVMIEYEVSVAASLCFVAVILLHLQPIRKAMRNGLIGDLFQRRKERR